MHTYSECAYKFKGEDGMVLGASLTSKLQYYKYDQPQVFAIAPLHLSVLCASLFVLLLLFSEAHAGSYVPHP